MRVNEPARSPWAIIISTLFIVLLIIPSLLSLPTALFRESFKVHPTNVDDHWLQHTEFQHKHRSQYEFLTKRNRSKGKSKLEQSGDVALKPLYNIVNKDATLRSVQEPIRGALQIRGASKDGKAAPTYRVEVIVRKTDSVAAVCRIQNACYDRRGNLYVHTGLKHNEQFLKHCAYRGHSAPKSRVQMKGVDGASKKQQSTVLGPAPLNNDRKETGIRYFEDSPAPPNKTVDNTNKIAYCYNETDVWTSVDFFGDFIPHKSFGHLVHFAKQLLPHIMAVQLPDHLFSRCHLLARLCLSPRKDPVKRKGTEDSTSCADHREVDRNLATVLPGSVLNARARAWMPQFFLRFKEQPIALSMDMLFPPEERNRSLVCFNSVTVSHLHRDRVGYEWIDSFHSSDMPTSPSSIVRTSFTTADNKHKENDKKPKTSRKELTSMKTTVNHVTSSTLPASESKGGSFKNPKKIETHIIRITVFNRAAHRPRHIANVHEVRIAIDTALRVRYPSLVHHTVLSEVFYERMSFHQQVDAVRDADIVIVGHGTGTAAVSSALFSKPCTLLVELYPFLVSSRTRQRNYRHYYARVNALDYAHVRAEPDRDTVFQCLVKSTMSTADRVQFRSFWKTIVSQRERDGNKKGFELILAQDDTMGKKGVEGTAENRAAQRKTVEHRHLYHSAVRHCLRKQNFAVNVRTMVDLVLDWTKTFQQRAKEGPYNSGKSVLDGERLQSKYGSCRAKRQAYPHFEQCPISVR